MDYFKNRSQEDYPAAIICFNDQQALGLHELGRKAAEILIKNIESETILDITKVIFDAEFIIRKSTRVLY